MLWARYIEHMGRKGMFIGFWVGKPEGRRLQEISRRTWEDNVEMDLK
jgi:hypothetical protein